MTSARAIRHPWTAPAGVALLAVLAATALARAPLQAEGWLDATHANTVLAGSAVLYWTHAWLRAEPLGRAASALAAAGAAGVLLVLAMGLAAGRLAAGLYEGTALLSALAVLAYLAMERAYRNRSAGVVVMGAVMAAVLCEIWLIARGLAAGGAPERGLAAYWEAAHRFALALGYGPLAVAALCAALARRAPAIATPGAIHAWLGVGAPLLALAAGFGAVWAGLESPQPRGLGRIALAALAAVLGLAAWVRGRGPEDPWLGRRAAFAFLAATASLVASGPLDPG